MSTGVVGTTGILNTGIANVGCLGPNSYGVPENFPLIPSDAGCHKCHGTGYKKGLITRRWKCCSKCARKYGTDKHAVNLKGLPPYHEEAVLVSNVPVATTLVTENVIPA